MEWREEKILVKGIFEEKKSLDGVILLFKGINQKRLLESQVALIERHKHLETVIETCLSALEKQEQKIIQRKRVIIRRIEKRRPHLYT